MHRWWLPGTLVLILLPAFWAQAQVVEVQGLFTGAAVLKVDGQSKMLRVGQTFAGVTLVESSSRSATIETNALIKGHSMRVLVDTGANLLVLNAGHARVLGLDSEAGDAVKVETAAGVVDGKNTHLEIS